MVKLKLWQPGSFLCIKVALRFDHQSYRFLCKDAMNHKENCANSRVQGVCFRVFFFLKSKNVELVEEGRGCWWYRIRWREWYGASLLHDTDIWAVCLSANSINKNPPKVMVEMVGIDL